MKIEKFRGPHWFLSNFYPITVNELPSVEHFYQASKFLDLEIREQIKNAKTAGDAKRLANANRGKIREGWDDLKETIMWSGLVKKFKDPGLARKLLSTKDEEIVHENYWGDIFWGTVNGKGQNILGKMLMKIREELVKESLK